MVVRGAALLQSDPVDLGGMLPLNGMQELYCASREAVVDGPLM
jgi:hypothetical protein